MSEKPSNISIEVSQNATGIPGGFELLKELNARNPALEVRTEQAECLDAIEAARRAGGDRALIQMATGLGKTTVVAADAQRYLSANPDSRLLFLCHQNDILDQARATFDAVLEERFTTGIFTGDEKQFDRVDCLFASFDTMRHWREAFMPDDFDYLIVDESHHAKAPTYEPTLKHFQPDFTLAVTATPDRHDRQDIRDLFGKEVFSLSLEEAIADGLTPAVSYRAIIDELADRGDIRDKLGRKHSFRELDRVIFVPRRDDEIVRLIEEASTAGQTQRLIFCRNIEHAMRFAAHFPRGAALHSDLPREQQRQLLNSFRRGHLDTLITIDKFNEGIDLREANQLVFLRVTQSKTVFLQQLGRGMRRTPGKDRVDVLDFVANCDRLVQLQSLSQEVRLAQARPDAREAGDSPKAVALRESRFEINERDIVELLGEIETITRFYARWSAEDSIAVYQRLRSELDRHPSVDELIEYTRVNPSLPSIFTVLDPYGRSIEALRQAASEDLQGELTLGQFSKRYNVSREKLEQFFAELGLKAGERKIGEKSIAILGKEAQETLLAHPWFHRPMYDADLYASRADLLESTGRALRVIDKTAAKLGLQYHEVRLPSGHTTRALTSEDAERLTAEMTGAASRAPAGFKSAYALADKLRVDRSTINKYAAELGIEPAIYRFGQVGTAAFDEDQQNQIATLVNDRYPDDVETISVLSKRLDVGVAYINRWVTEYGIEPVKYKYKGKTSTGFKADAVELIELLASELLPARRRDDEVTLNRISREHSVRAEKLVEALAALAIEPELRRTGARIAPVIGAAAVSAVVTKAKALER